MTSKALPCIFKDLLKSFTCKNLYYVKGPGSFMAIKISYIFLKTLSISLKIPLFACNSFSVNNNTPIKAFGKMYFLQENDNIKTQLMQKEIKSNLTLPKNITDISFSKDIEPLYVLPAI